MIARLEALRPSAFALAAAGLAWALSVAFFSPKFQLWNFSIDGTFETTRARTFLLQVDAPLRRDIEPAMQWRLLPPAVTHGLGLRGHAALAVPWLGVLALLVWTARFLRTEGLDARQALLGVVLVATTSAVLVPTGWLGVNDGWLWLGMLVAAFGRTRAPVALACLLTPWIDERFIIGLPLICAVRQLRLQPDATLSVGGMLRRLGQVAPWMLPYPAIRLLAGFLGLKEGGGAFILGSFSAVHVWLPWAPLGWWMGLRAGWWPVGVAVADAGVRNRTGSWLLGAIAVATALVMVAFAADLSRSIAILLPVVVLGIIALARRDGADATRRLAWASGLNLILPAAHVVYTKVDAISPLPVELARLAHRLL